MSFLAGRLAATEGAYFLHESKNAVGRLAQKLPPPPPPSASADGVKALTDDAVGTADVLPEILRHSLPIKGAAVPEPSSLSFSSRWLVHSSSSSSAPVLSDSHNPLRSYISLPQATFGPKRWQVPLEQPNISASTANELRHDRYSPADSEKIKAALVGYSQIGKAFAVATSIVFGGATILLAYAANSLQLHSIDDIKTKGRDLIQPGADMVKEQMGPFRIWAEKMSRKWHREVDGEAKEKTIIKELARTLGSRTSN
ncbi:unnamed protein product [Musa acuminata subsp. malaccensis]|uniref:(wild Malaysian banana) hypothetical protein n=1 Tax=Musa acuminata subsp. malaccensis TaxID=214687 RepID=A0A804KJW2_MUSAM|nr:PREDICTED: uncharacterized protein LOC103998055 [Musa acuminata subsp. malaccensis]CAG1835283.1 unnamed protein product [Musa acuminata subsp. malaccensis]